MKDDPLPGWVMYHENRPHVLRMLATGRVSYLALTDWSFADRFMAFLMATGFLGFAEETYPSPRVKEEVPVAFLAACAVQMAVRGEPAFSSLPYLLRSGAVMTRVGFNLGCRPGGGFNGKNRKPRESMMDQDTERKFFKDTRAGAVFRWFNNDVPQWLRQNKAFAQGGTLVCDLSLIPVPDNPHYAHVARRPLDQDGNFVDVRKMTPAERKRFKYTPCYALVSLLYLLPRDEGYLYVGAYLLNGAADEIRAARGLVRSFMEAVGPGMVDQLILDRGFLDGAFISDMKEKYGIEVLVPLRSDMKALEEAQVLWAQRMRDEPKKCRWEPYSIVKDKNGKVLRKEEVAGMGDITVWDACRAPLYVALMRTTDADGNQDVWGVASPRHYKKPGTAFDDYARRTQIEERHRQLKGAWKLMKFTSPDFNLVVAHVFFILLTYTLLELYLHKGRLRDRANRFIDTLRRDEQLGGPAVVVYAGSCFAALTLEEYSQILLHLRRGPLERLRKILKTQSASPIRAP